MLVDGKHYRTIWLKENDPNIVQIIDQRHLPHKFIIEDLTTVDEVARAIQAMHVRGAGLIGATAGFGMYVAALEASPSSFMEDLVNAGETLKATRPTAVNLEWAVQRQLATLRAVEGDVEAKIHTARNTAQAIADEDAEFCRRIGEHGVSLIKEIGRRKGGEPVDVLTHCNAQRHGAHLRRPRSGYQGTRVGGRNPSSQPGSTVDSLGIGSARRGPYGHRR
jgi:methylthioribose-1-phosphate isomerase